MSVLTLTSAYLSLAIGLFQPTQPVTDHSHAIYHAAYVVGLSPDRPLSIAWCESRYDPQARNPRSGARGLFQFIYSTWQIYAARYLPPSLRHYDNAYDAYTNAYLATIVMRNHGYSDWYQCLR